MKTLHQFTEGLIGTRNLPEPSGRAPKPEWGSGGNKNKLPKPPKIDKQKEKADKLAKDRAAADAAGKAVAQKAVDDKKAGELRKQQDAAVKAEKQVQTLAKAQPKKGARLGGEKETMKTAPVSRQSTIKKTSAEPKSEGPSKSFKTKPEVIDKTREFKKRFKRAGKELRKTPGRISKGFKNFMRPKDGGPRAPKSSSVKTSARMINRSSRS